jgi:hypothetical protein
MRRRDWMTEEETKRGKEVKERRGQCDIYCYRVKTGSTVTFS